MEQHCLKPILGKNITLREIEVADADFVLSLRNDKKRGKYLSKTSDDVVSQVEYIKNYKAKAQNYYFIIEDKKHHPIGTVRIYDIRNNSFCWGSWLLSREAPVSAGIESALLVYEFAFYTLGFFRAHFDVRKGNQKVIDFHQRMGAVIVDETDVDVFFHYDKESYERVKPRYVRFLK